LNRSILVIRWNSYKITICNVRKKFINLQEKENKLMRFVVDREVYRKWEIEGHPTYFVGEDKKMYHVVYRCYLKECKQILKGYSLGYIIDSKFYTLKKLRTLLKKNF
jgi:hypothetical protein